MSTKELKPLNCPFCGHPARKLRRLMEDIGTPNTYCNCSNENCQAHHPRFRVNEWNQRATPGLDRYKLRNVINEIDFKKLYEDGMPFYYVAANPNKGIEGVNLSGEVIDIISDAILAAEKELR